MAVKLATMRTQLAALIEEQSSLDSVPRIGLTRWICRRQVALCRSRWRLENRIADLEFEGNE